MARLLHALRWLGYVLVSRVLRLWYALRAERTPLWVKTAAWGLIAYVVWPLDIVPDWVPILGWTDDLVAIIAAGLALQWYSRGPVKREADDRAKRMLGLPHHRLPAKD